MELSSPLLSSFLKLSGKTRFSAVNGGRKGSGGGVNVKPAFIINTKSRTYHMGRRIFALKIGSSVQNSSDLAHSICPL